MSEASPRQLIPNMCPLLQTKRYTLFFLENQNHDNGSKHDVQIVKNKEAMDTTTTQERFRQSLLDVANNGCAICPNSILSDLDSEEEAGDYVLKCSYPNIKTNVISLTMELSTNNS